MIEKDPCMIELNPENWVEEYGDYLFRYANSRMRDANAAEEVVQETFLAGVRYSSQYSGTGSVRGWLIAILKRKIVDYFRSRKKHAGAIINDEDDAFDPSTVLFDQQGNWKPGAFKWAPSPERELEMSELSDVVQDCLKSIPQGQADVFVLSVMEEMETETICEQLSISPSNMWVRMHRARLGLAKCVSEKWDVEVQHVG